MNTWTNLDWEEEVKEDEATGISLTSCLNAKIDLALGRMRDGVATELHIQTDRKS